MQVSDRVTVSAGEAHSAKALLKLKFEGRRTTANHFILNPPFTNDGKKKCQGVDNGDSQAQFCWTEAWVRQQRCK